MRPNLKLRKTRSVHVTIATTMLVVPASAVALSGTVANPAQSGDAQAAPAEAALNLSVPSGQIRYDHPVTVTGHAPAGAAGRTIELQTALGPAASWHPLARATIGRRGGFRLRGPLRQSGLIRVAPASAGPVAVATSTAATAGGVGLEASPPRRVAVAAALRVHRRSANLLSGDALKVRGRLLPGTAGRAVRLQGHFASGWRTLAGTRTGAGGVFGLRTTPASGLQRRLRVLFGGDRSNARAVSAAGAVTVYDQSMASWYDDSGSTACGFHAGLGVANVSLPCGTKVRFRHGGHSVTAVVDDRGPYVGGRTWDLNQNTAAALNFGGVGTVWASR